MMEATFHPDPAKHIMEKLTPGSDALQKLSLGVWSAITAVMILDAVDLLRQEKNNRTNSVGHAI